MKKVNIALTIIGLAVLCLPVAAQDRRFQSDAKTKNESKIRKKTITNSGGKADAKRPKVGGEDEDRQSNVSGKDDEKTSIVGAQSKEKPRNPADQAKEKQPNSIEQDEEKQPNDGEQADVGHPRSPDESSSSSTAVPSSAQLVDKILVKLEDRDPDVRLGAVKNAARFSDKRVIEKLNTILLNDPSSSIRLAAANTLGLIGNPSAAPYLWNCTRNDADNHVRLAAQKALENLKKRPHGFKRINHSKLRQLALQLKDSRAEVRKEATLQLARVDYPDVDDWLKARLLEDTDEIVRAAAAKSLGLRRNSMAISALKKAAVFDKEPSVRQAALHALDDLSKAESSPVRQSYVNSTDVEISKTNRSDGDDGSRLKINQGDFALGGTFSITYSNHSPPNSDDVSGVAVLLTPSVGYFVAKGLELHFSLGINVTAGSLFQDNKAVGFGFGGRYIADLESKIYPFVGFEIGPAIYEPPRGDSITALMINIPAGLLWEISPNVALNFSVALNMAYNDDLGTIFSLPLGLFGLETFF